MFLQLTIIIILTKTATYVRATCWATFCKIILYRYSYCKNMQHSFVFSGCVLMCELVRTKPQLHCCCTFQDIICVSFISWKYLLRFFLEIFWFHCLQSFPSGHITNSKVVWNSKQCKIYFEMFNFLLVFPSTFVGLIACAIETSIVLNYLRYWYYICWCDFAFGQIMY